MPDGWKLVEAFCVPQFFFHVSIGVFILIDKATCILPPCKTTKVGHLWGSWTSHLWIWGRVFLGRKICERIFFFRKHIKLVSTFLDIFKLSQQFLEIFRRDGWGISNFAFISRFWTDPCFTFSILWPCCYGGHLEPRKHLKKKGCVISTGDGLEEAAWCIFWRKFGRELVLVDSFGNPIFRDPKVSWMPAQARWSWQSTNSMFSSGEGHEWHLCLYMCTNYIDIHYIYYICIYIQFKFPLHCKAWYQYLGLENKIKLLGKHETVQGW